MRAPFRLDFTAEVLRRLSNNVVDRLCEDGTYLRILADARGSAVVRVRQIRKDAVLFETDSTTGERFVPVIRRMLGTAVDLHPWYRSVKTVPWLERLSRTVRGVKPPRYPSVWEALCHSIVFQQISIHAAGAIMQRTVEALAPGHRVDGVVMYPFPEPSAVAAASVETMRAAGLSINKVAALQDVAAAVLRGSIDEAALESLPSAQAAAHLAQLRGIGPWSATVVLLRGLGRLDVFPLKDSGVASSLRLLGENPDVNVEELLATLGEQRGMLYFHLLLGRIAQRHAAAATAATGSGL